MTSQLALYNKALFQFGERKLTSLSENREPRRALDDIYDSAIRACLEAGYWHFARRAVKLDHDADAEVQFGYLFQFEQPDDFIKLYDISADELFRTPLNDYVNEQSLFRANFDPIYLNYISSHADFGGNLTKWPEVFADFVGLDLADRASYRITQDKDLRDKIRADRKKAKIVALSFDAQQGPPRALPTGTWVSSRTWGYGGDIARGSLATE